MFVKQLLLTCKEYPYINISNIEVSFLPIAKLDRHATAWWMSASSRKQLNTQVQPSAITLLFLLLSVVLLIPAVGLLDML